MKGAVNSPITTRHLVLSTAVLERGVEIANPVLIKKKKKVFREETDAELIQVTSCATGEDRSIPPTPPRRGTGDVTELVWGARVRRPRWGQNPGCGMGAGAKTKRKRPQRVVDLYCRRARLRRTPPGPDGSKVSSRYTAKGTCFETLGSSRSFPFPISFARRRGRYRRKTLGWFGASVRGAVEHELLSLSHPPLKKKGTKNISSP